MKDIIKNEALKLGLDMCGIANHDGKSVIVCLFPYFVNFQKGNISRYSVATDYHKITKVYLEKLSKNAGLSEFEIYADISPFDERQLAVDAGLGIIGKNGLLINKKYGSYVFIGLIILNKLMLESDTPLDNKCVECGKCIKACPGKALTESGFNIKKCLSEITQKKGELTESEKMLIIKTGMVWGCDACSEACPMNKDVPETPIPEFKENIITSLKLKDIENLSNKEFLQKYPDRAFTWRGKKVLLRNFGVLEDCLPTDKSFEK